MLLFKILFAIRFNYFFREHFRMILFIIFGFNINIKLYYIYFEYPGAVMKFEIDWIGYEAFPFLIIHLLYQTIHG